MEKKYTTQIVQLGGVVILGVLLDGTGVGSIQFPRTAEQDIKDIEDAIDRLNKRYNEEAPIAKTTGDVLTS